MHCPKCGIVLNNKTIEGVEVDECRKCEGIWFDKDELRQIKDKSDSDLHWMDFEIWKHPEKFKAISESIDCPNCSTKMNVLDYDNTNIEIAYCANCQGVWLDKDELKKIIDALEEEILIKSMNEYVHATIEEAKELITGSESFISEWKDFTTILRFVQYRFLTNHPLIHKTIVNFQQNPLNR
jgi:Zn-finger nucleic acid-binding protein